MAKCTINYCCGHGNVTKNLTGAIKERESYITWAENNLLCPDCYKAKKAAEDASADKIAKICLVPGLDPIISIEVSGQIASHQDALYALGYRWSDSTTDGLLGYLSIHRPQRVLAVLQKVESAEQIGQWINQQGMSLDNIGYHLMKDSLNSLDLSYLSQRVAETQSAKRIKVDAQAILDAIKVADPKPDVAPLRKRINEIEKVSGGKWNGKIYGRKGGYYFYVANEKHIATDTEVDEREIINSARNAWEQKYATEIAAAK